MLLSSSSSSSLFASLLLLQSLYHTVCLRVVLKGMTRCWLAYRQTCDHIARRRQRACGREQAGHWAVMTTKILVYPRARTESTLVGICRRMLNAVGAGDGLGDDGCQQLSHNWCIFTHPSRTLVAVDKPPEAACELKQSGVLCIVWAVGYGHYLLLSTNTSDRRHHAVHVQHVPNSCVNYGVESMV